MNATFTCRILIKSTYSCMSAWMCSLHCQKPILINPNVFLERGTRLSSALFYDRIKRTYSLLISSWARSYSGNNKHNFIDCQLQTWGRFWEQVWGADVPVRTRLDQIMPAAHNGPHHHHQNDTPHMELIKMSFKKIYCYRSNRCHYTRTSLGNYIHCAVQEIIF